MTRKTPVMDRLRAVCKFLYNKKTGFLRFLGNRFNPLSPAVKLHQKEVHTLYNRSIYLFSSSLTIPLNGRVAAMPYTGARPPDSSGCSLI
jgi:hypothetical protein